LVFFEGSGKTTLLSLIAGDHPQAYANEIHLFNQKRGSGETIWDIKSRIGFVSPELHMLFSSSRLVLGAEWMMGGVGGPLSVLEAVQTGWWAKSREAGQTRVKIHGGGASVGVNNGGDADELERRAKELLKDFGMGEEEYMKVPFKSLSMGEQRLLLILRALVSRPRLVIMDEPFQGLDSEIVGKVHGWLEKNLGVDQALILVTHYEEEIPGFVKRRLELGEGKVVVCL
jgi:molybdate transport system ATP-binding protein